MKVKANMTLCWVADDCIAKPEMECIFCCKPMCPAHADGRLWQWNQGGIFYQSVKKSSYSCLLCIDEVESRWKLGEMRLMVEAPGVSVKKVNIPAPVKEYSLAEAMAVQRYMEYLCSISKTL